MLNIPNIKELNGLEYKGFKLSHCDYLESGSNLEREEHYQIQFDRMQYDTKPACLTIGARADMRGRYLCKLYYRTTDNVIWQEWLVIDVLRKRDELLNAITSMIHSHINRTT
jgi:hypothetical protein